MRKKGLENTLDDDEHQIHELSELGEVMQSLDQDSINSEKLSNVDFNTRLSSVEINSIMIIDELANLGILPTEDTGLTRRKKRLSVSKDGLGRQEKVQIVQGQREQQTGGGMAQGFKNLFTRKE